MSSITESPSLNKNRSTKRPEVRGLRNYLNAIGERATFRRVLGICLGICLVVSALVGAGSANAATFTVNSSNDVDDTVCDVAHCSLREALLAANAAAGPDLIDFAIPAAGVQTIAVTAATPLPAISETVTVDGYTQPGSSPNTLAIGNDAVILIELDGSAGGTAAAFRIGADSCIIRGLAINGFSGAGINHTGVRTGTLIEGNFIGLDADGVTAAGNTGTGVRCVATTGVTVGGTTPAARNVISSNGVQGVEFRNAAPSNIVQGNYIGTDSSGTLARGNGDRGVYIAGGMATGNLIGGAVAGAGNVISGNTTEGIRLTANTNTVSGNLIGTNAMGTGPIPNGFIGVQLNGSFSNVVGGTTALERNVISGNASFGVVINRDGTGHTVLGNYIGTDITGTVAIPNGDAGINLVFGSSNTIGGTSAAARNVVSGNSGAGVKLGSTGASSNMVIGNFIGVDVSGVLPLGNGGNGVALNGEGAVAVSLNTIGGAAAGAGNVISSNAMAGVLATGAMSTGNAVISNFIGTDLTGAVSLPNGTGVTIQTNASLQVQNNWIFNNPTGILLSASAEASTFAAPSDGNCVVFNGAGVSNTTGTSTTFDNNWWGSPDGPSGVGPGTGDSVSADVVFSPFLASAPVGCPTSTGVVTIVKDTLPDGATDFGFTGSFPGFSLDDDADGTLPNTISFFAAPGIYDVTEDVVAGFSLTNLSCVDPTANTTITLATRTAAIDLAAAETVTCTFENTQDGSVTIVKDTIPDGPQDFSFSGGLGVFSLDDDADGTLANFGTFSVPPGSYDVTEAAVAGFALTGLTCDDPTFDTVTDLGTRTAMIEVDAGEVVTCTFENSQGATVPIEEIPTLGSFGLLILVALLLGCGVLALRRYRPANPEGLT